MDVILKIKGDLYGFENLTSLNGNKFDVLIYVSKK